MNGNWDPASGPDIAVRLDLTAEVTPAQSNTLDLAFGAFMEAPVGFQDIGANNSRSVYVLGTSAKNTFGISSSTVSLGSNSNNVWTYDAGAASEIFIVPRQSTDTIRFTDDNLAERIVLVDRGGDGSSDTLDFTALQQGIAVDLSNTSSYQPFMSNAPLAFLRLIGSWEHVDGTRFDDVIIGNGVANILYHGGGGFDYLEGKSGNDIYELSNLESSDITINENFVDNSDTDRDTIRIHSNWIRDVGASLDLTTNEKQTVYEEAGKLVELTVAQDTIIEALTGSYFDDVLIGDDRANFIRGLFGNDLIIGNDGDDLLFGEYGIDEVRGGKGEDVVSGGNGTLDVVIGGAGNDREEILDNADNEFKLVQFSSQDPNGSQIDSAGFNGDQIVFDGASSLRTAHWQFRDLDPSLEYRVYTTWSPDTVANTSTAAHYSIRSDSLHQFAVDQSVGPDNLDENGLQLGRSQDRPWQLLDTVSASTGSIVVFLSDVGMGSEIADAVRIEPVRIIDSGLGIPVISYSDGAPAWQPVAGAERYEVQRSLNGIDGWLTLTRTTSTAYNPVGGSVLGGTTDSRNGYYFRVRSLVGDQVASSWSDVLDRLTPSSGKPYIVQLTANVDRSIASQNPTISWPLLNRDGNNSTFEPADTVNIYRRSSSVDDWQHLATVDESTLDVDGNQLVWTDTSIGLGSQHEYRVEREFTRGDGTTETSFGYLQFGIETDLVNEMSDRGSVVLIVDDATVGPLANELSRFESDLVGDGWNVIRHDVDVSGPRKQTARDIKQLIYNEYTQVDQNVTSVILFGDIPENFQQRLTNHPDNHDNGELLRSYATDAYYGDMWDIHSDPWMDDDFDTNPDVDGEFATLADVPVEPNSDGVPVELSVGRIDMADMTGPNGFAENEMELLQRYLDKDHAYRHGQTDVRRRGIIDDRFGSRSAYASFSAMFGVENVDRRDWFGTVTEPGESYLWGHLSSPGASTASSLVGGGRDAEGGVLNTKDFAQRSSHTVFNHFFASYIFEWQKPNALMRAPLANDGYGLTATWGARPQKFNHHMALGGTVGFGNVISINNPGSECIVGMGCEAGYGASGDFAEASKLQDVTVALMGDPTLRLHVVAPATNVQVFQLGQRRFISWNPSTAELNLAGELDDDFLGYHVYRRPAGSNEKFDRITRNPTMSTRHMDPDGAGYEYMVRAVKMESSASGSYVNLSQGAFSSGGFSGGASQPVPLDFASAIDLRDDSAPPMPLSAKQTSDLALGSVNFPRESYHYSDLASLRQIDSTHDADESEIRELLDDVFAHQAW